MPYCEPCSKLLRGDATPERSSFRHHPDLSSVQNALESSCPICTRVWGRSVQALETSPEVTGYFRHHEDGERDVLFFHAGLRKQWFVLIPWSDMRDHQIFPLSERTDSQSALDFLRHKYLECKSKHDECKNEPDDVSFYPTRVIHVGAPEDSHIRVCDTQGLHIKEPYVCLSYCWGQVDQLKLTKETEQKLRDGYLISAMAKTFQDAIFITKMLGIKYLWIDSLCIFQDNDADWSKEASSMGSVYSQATLTLAASWAKDSEGGLFSDRDPELLQPLCIEITSPDDANNERMEDSQFPPAGLYWLDSKRIWDHNVERTPLNTRAWCSQERVLSNRVVYFTKTQLFWECHKCIACENYPEILPGWARPMWYRDLSVIKRKLHSFKASHSHHSITDRPIADPDLEFDAKQDLYKAWGSFRIQYSRCDMTKEKDKLVTIKGIASNLGQALGDELVAGLWRNRLLEEMCWFKEVDEPSPPPPTAWRAPTWSWASNNGTIWISNTTKRHRWCVDRQFWGEIIDLDVRARPSGELEHASLRVRCKLIRASIPEPPPQVSHAFDGFPYLIFTETGVNITYLGSNSLSMQFDHDGKPHYDDVYMIILQRCPHTEGVDGYVEDIAEGLFMIPSPGLGNTFKRIGLFTFAGAEYAKLVLAEHEAAESTEITII